MIELIIAASSHPVKITLFAKEGIAQCDEYAWRSP
jgi:hypothetical protein